MEKSVHGAETETGKKFSGGCFHPYFGAEPDNMGYVRITDDISLQYSCPTKEGYDVFANQNDIGPLSCGRL